LKYYVGITDYDWFKRLSEQTPDEVNFWRPGSRASFKVIDVGAPFLFKLHSPRNFIVGGGFFIRHTVLPVSLTWEAFGIKNGATSHSELLKRLRKYRNTNEIDPVIGCTILTEPFFFDEAEWIPVPNDWKPQTQPGRTYDTATTTGKRLWDAVEVRLAGREQTTGATDFPTPDSRESVMYGQAYLARARLGQGTFRVLVTDAYLRRCAVTGERTLPVLEAAHIRPFAESGPNRITNGLLLRSDLHKLFDRGYLTVTPDFHVEVSPRIKEEFDNGKYYYGLNGIKMGVLPEEVSERPSSEYLRWHNENIFR
jgi:putative restriction endonuclease